MSGDREWRDGGLTTYWRGCVFHCEGGKGVQIMTGRAEPVVWIF